MNTLSKLQIRAKVLSVISSIKTLQYRSEEALAALSGELKVIEDKNFLIDVFLKEYIKLEEDESGFCAYLIKNLIPIKIITEKSFEYLKSNKLSDKYKYKIVQLLRICGADYNYEELPSYFDNPQDVLDFETKRLLDSAVFNPESMLDFLDFISAVSDKDKIILLQSLNSDYSGDTLANIVYPILYSDFDDEFILHSIDVLIDTKSSLAIEPFEYLIEVSSNEKIVSSCKKGLKLLKLAGASKEKADMYFKNIIKSSVISQVFATIPDGTGKQAILLTRKHDNENFSITAFVISDSEGIVDCFGFFNISSQEITKIVKKFSMLEGKYTVPKEYIKSQIDNAQKLNVINKTPYHYEFICWKPVLTDISPLNYSLEYYANENCSLLSLDKDQISELMTQEYTLRWFFTPNDNKTIKMLTDDIYSLQTPDIKKINLLLIDNIDSIFDKDTLNLWINRFYSLIYILRQNGKLLEADKFYTILNDENAFEFFREVIVQRSIFSFFAAQRENIRESFFSKNIFSKKTANKYESVKLDKIIDLLKRSWIG